MDDIDRAVLRFAAAHRAVTDGQLGVLAGGETPAAERNVARLIGEGLLARRRVTGSDPGCLVITETGLAAIESRLPAPGWEMRDLRRALAAGWISLRAQDGRFNDLTGGVLSRRELEAHDRELASADRPASAVRAYGLRVGGISSAHKSGLHHPDLLMAFRAGWVAAEIVLGGVTPPGLAALLTAYGADDRFLRVVFLTETERVAGAIERAAVSAGVAAVLSVQWLELP
jgi:hypothetical protein